MKKMTVVSRKDHPPLPFRIRELALEFTEESRVQKQIEYDLRVVQTAVDHHNQGFKRSWALDLAKESIGRLSVCGVIVKVENAD